jgi:hypothetical protein
MLLDTQPFSRGNLTVSYVDADVCVKKQFRANYRQDRASDSIMATLAENPTDGKTRARSSFFGALLRARLSRIVKTMEVHFTPEQEAQLAQVAAKAGTDAERLVKDAALRLLEQDARFRAAVREGIAQADRREFIEETEMDDRLEQMLRSMNADQRRPVLCSAHG